jgi:hypothetical protein
MKILSSFFFISLFFLVLNIVMIVFPMLLKCICIYNDLTIILVKLLYIYLHPPSKIHEISELIIIIAQGYLLFTMKLMIWFFVRALLSTRLSCKRFVIHVNINDWVFKTTHETLVLYNSSIIIEITFWVFLI